ncbi:hypothetical protein AQUCO_04600027v1 [Aquilegia coerulea]|uniref:Uncharacterized protein n=1 Tax=Aquilegia coerulea TaxID=218851 RepID=A0A2G5CLM0_AQUCA|nr:hypothetical protein AQUCO_04600027v1 [Aquilegia coerulea]
MNNNNDIEILLKSTSNSYYMEYKFRKILLYPLSSYQVAQAPIEAQDPKLYHHLTASPSLQNHYNYYSIFDYHCLVAIQQITPAA